MDLLRLELFPQSATLKLPEWEAALGVSVAQAGVNQSVSVAGRQNAVIAAFRESGASTKYNIRAAVEPLLRYSVAQQNTLEVIECSRSGLRLAHDYAIADGVIPAGGTLSRTVKVADTAKVSKAGAQVTLVITAIETEKMRVDVTAPDGTVYTGTVGALGRGSAVNGTRTAYVKAAAGEDINGTWTVAITDTGALGGSITLSTLFVEGIGIDAKKFQGLGRSIFDWGVLVDKAKIGTNPDYPGARKKIERLNPAHCEGHLIFKADAVLFPTAGNAAIPDEPTTLPDGCLPGV